MIAGGTGVVAISKAEAYAEGDYPLAVAISDDVNVEISGKVKAQGTGVFAGSFADASVGEAGCPEEDNCFEDQGNVTVAVKKGKVQGGVGYYGVVVKGGDDNLIEVGKKGTITSNSFMAILGGTEDETVENSGVVAGDVDLDGGWNAFNNNKSGKFYSGDIIYLGAGNVLTNAGDLSPGGPWNIQTSLLTGDLVQTSGGQYSVDVDMGKGQSDVVNVTGFADLAGKVSPILSNPFSGKQSVTILTADGGVTNDGIGVKDTALIDYSLKVNPNDVVLKTEVDFAPKGLDKGAKVGQNLNQVYKNGGPSGLWPVTYALLALPKVSDVSNAYQQLSGNQYSQLEISELYSQETFSRDQMNCPVRGDGAAVVAAPMTAQPLKLAEGDPAYGVPGVAPFINENECIWARVRYRNLQQDANSGTAGFDEDATGISGGGQWAFGGAWYGGVAFGYENSQIDSNTSSQFNRLNSDGDRYRVGGSLKYIAGPWFVGGAITGGWSNFDSTRQISFPGFASVATSSQDLQNVAGQVRLAYQMATAGAWYLKPLVDFNVTNVDMDLFTEKGANGAALKVSSNDETVFSATPALEIGTQWGHPGGTLVRPYVRGGVSFYSDADFPIAAGFAAAPGVGPFVTNGSIDDVLGDVSAGLNILGAGGGVLSFSYDGRFGDTFQENSVTARASVPLSGRWSWWR